MEIWIDKVLLPKIKEIREEIFINEQKFSVEFDETDEICYHLLLKDSEEAVGVGRLYETKEKNVYTLGRIAVLKPFRKGGYGAKIVKALEEKAKALGGEKMVISAQCQARVFYEKLGYTAFGEEYLDEHCPHIDMEKKL